MESKAVEASVYFGAGVPYWGGVWVGWRVCACGSGPGQKWKQKKMRFKRQEAKWTRRVTEVCEPARERA